MGEWGGEGQDGGAGEARSGRLEDLPGTGLSLGSSGASCRGLSQGSRRSDLTLAGEGARPRASPADTESVFHVQASKRFVWAEACSRPERQNHHRVIITPSPDEERGSESQAICLRSHASTVYIRVPGWTRESDPRGQRVGAGSAPS